MVQCPKCSNQFEADFGMIPCPDCGNIVIVNVDGQAQVENDQSGDRASIEPASEEVSEEVYGGNYTEEPETSNDFSENFQEFEEESSLDEIPDVVAEKDESVVENINDGWSESGDEERTQLSSEKLDDIAAFGNSEVSMAKEGMYLYDVRISGIDSVQIKKLLLESITDKRFGWNIKELMESIKNGELLIEKISAVKASIIVNRIKNLPVSIDWRQNVVTKMDV